jgi:basic amino acid/polyamine antiporter, APA family
LATIRTILNQTPRELLGAARCVAEGIEAEMSDMLATKPLDSLMKEAGEHGEGGLRRVLGPVNLVTLGIGAIIGAGIFVLTGTVAANFTGPAIILSFILAGIGCVFAGLCYAEFASLIPIAG